MKRLCMVGNSHLGAIKLGWEDVQVEFRGVAATFFGAFGKHMNHLLVRGGILLVSSEQTRVLSTSSEDRKIDLAEYDGVALFGGELNIIHAINLYRNYRSDEHRHDGTMIHRVSQECFDAALLGLLRNTNAIRLAADIARVSKCPVLVSPQPMPSPHILTSVRHDVFRNILEAGDELSLYGSYRRSLRALSTLGFTIIEQPEATKIAPLLTDQEYSKGSTRLLNSKQEHPEDDFVHMNRLYGAEVLRQIIPLFTGGGGGIRTPGGLAPSTVFKTAAIDRSATPPQE
jgi:hypothetical protein